VTHLQPVAEEPGVDLLSLPAEKFEDAARVTLSALAGYVRSLPPCISFAHYVLQRQPSVTRCHACTREA